MRTMRFYQFLSRLGRTSYLLKIMIVSFIGVHIPMIVTIAWVVLGSDIDATHTWHILAALLAATLIGTGLTLTALYALLAPVRQAATAIKTYLAEKSVPRLPTAYPDEVGVLMANIQEGITRLDAALDAANTRASDAQRRRQEQASLLSSLSHEFRTPLNHIIGFAEMMSSEALGPLGRDAYKSYAGDIGSSGGQLLELLQTVLDLSQAEAGEVDLRPGRLRLADAAAGALALVHLEAERAGVKLRFLVAQDAPVFADPRALKQMVLLALRILVGSAGAGRMVTVTGSERAGVATLDLSHDGDAWAPGDLPPTDRHPAGRATAAELDDATDSAGMAHAGPTALKMALIRSMAAASGGALALPSQARGRLIRLSLPSVDSLRLSPRETSPAVQYAS
jgi:hypothetical protein